MANNNNNAVLNAPESSSINPVPGTLLADKRKQRGLSERETADALKISVSRLKSIEANEFDVFPSETYIRGHIRNYCRFLKIDEQAMLTVYDNSKPVVESNDLYEHPEDSTVVSNHKRWWYVYLVLMMLALLWIFSYWLIATEGSDSDLSDGLGQLPSSEWHREQQQSAPILALPVTERQDPKENNTKEADNGGKQLDSDTARTVIGDDFSSGNQSLTEQSAVEDQAIIVSKLTAAEVVKSIQPPVPETVAPIPEGDTLRFGFKNESWVQVIDASGAVLFKGLNKPGAALDLNGKAPFNVVIGNVEGTSLVYNGENVELVPPRGRNTLRLSLGG